MQAKRHRFQRWLRGWKHSYLNFSKFVDEQKGKSLGVGLCVKYNLIAKAVGWRLLSKMPAISVKLFTSLVELYKISVWLLYVFPHLPRVPLFTFSGLRQSSSSWTLTPSPCPWLVWCFFHLQDGDGVPRLWYSRSSLNQFNPKNLSHQPRSHWD